MNLPELPTVSIISVNFNGYDYTKRCLESLSALKYPNFEVLVVENGSTQEADWHALEVAFPEVKFLFSEVNLGFAGGNNLAIKEAKGDLLWLLNNDTEVAPDSLDHLVETMKSNSRIGMCSSRLMYFEPEGMVQYAGMTDLHPLTMRNRSIGYRESMKDEYKAVYPTSFIHGASAVVRKDLITEIGLMYDFYFLYYEEYDWCYRARKAGYEIYYDGRAEVLHKESAVTQPNSPLKTHYLNRNRILFARLNFDGWTKISSILFTVFAAIPKGMLVDLLQGRSKNIRSAWKAITWNMRTSLSDLK